MNQRLIKLSLLLCICLGVSSTKTGLLAAEQDDDRVQTAITGLAASEKKGSIKIQASSVYISFDIFPKNSENIFDGTRDARQILKKFGSGEKMLSLDNWLRDGNRSLYDSRKLTPPNTTNAHGLLSGHFVDSYDGTERKYFYAPDGEVGAGFIQKQTGSSGPAIADKWLGNFSGSYSQDLKQGAPHFIGIEKLNDLEVWKLEAKLTRGETTETHTVWVAPSRSFREVRKEIEIRIDGPEFKSRKLRYETLEFANFNDTWVPKRGVCVNWLVGNNGKVFWRKLELFHLTELESLTSDTRSVFDFKFPLGTQFTDPKAGINAKSSLEVTPYIDLLNDKGVFAEDIVQFVQHLVDKIPDN